MRLFGYTSTSQDRIAAERFSYCNKEAGLKRVLFHIHWHNHKNHFYIDSGAYNHEEEILLFDGSQFVVVSVLDEQYEEFEIQNLP